MYAPPIKMAFKNIYIKAWVSLASHFSFTHSLFLSTSAFALLYLLLRVLFNQNQIEEGCPPDIANIVAWHQSNFQTAQCGSPRCWITAIIGDDRVCDSLNWVRRTGWSAAKCMVFAHFSGSEKSMYRLTSRGFYHTLEPSLRTAQARAISAIKGWVCEKCFYSFYSVFNEFSLQLLPV